MSILVFLNDFHANKLDLVNCACVFLGAKEAVVLVMWEFVSRKGISIPSRPNVTIYFKQLVVSPPVVRSLKY